MAKYTYVVTNKAHNADSWIHQLQRINPVSLASSHHTEIHFTQPKAELPAAALMPHVTFISANGRTHWYLRNAGGTYTVEQIGSVEAQPNEFAIAKDVIADAVLLNWIKPAPQKALVDDAGWTTKETKTGKKDRMKKWQ